MMTFPAHRALLAMKYAVAIRSKATKDAIAPTVRPLFVIATIKRLISFLQL
jgi:hypothetical protein